MEIQPTSKANSVWMRECGANYGARFHRVQSLEELDQWKEDMRNVPGGGNPVPLLVWSDFPQEIRDQNREIEYYGYFELSVRYLLDPKGHGKETSDLINFYKDLGEGIHFRTAFRTNFGISAIDFEAQWWDLMSDYLSN